MLYMPSYTGGKFLYSAQFVRSVLLHSRDLYNISIFLSRKACALLIDSST